MCSYEKAAAFLSSFWKCKGFLMAIHTNCKITNKSTLRKYFIFQEENKSQFKNE